MAKLEDGTIAGSILTYIQAFKNVMEFTGATVEDAVKMTSGNQAKEFGLDSKGAIAAGKEVIKDKLTGILSKRFMFQEELSTSL